MIRRQKTCHILNAEGIGSHFLDFSGNILPVVQRISITQGIAQCNLHVAFFLFGCLYCCLQVPDVVKTVENTDNIDSVGDGFLHEIFHHIICIVVITENILSAEQHLQLGILKSVSQLSQPVPRIFL